MTVRLRRLMSDHRIVTRCFADHPQIEIESIEGDPPERYRIRYRLTGLVVQNDRIVTKSDHLVEAYLPLGYPRQPPQCRMLTPTFHPNIAPHAICIGDHWSAGESLAALLARIGELITFQSYNLKSPLNGEAARWVAEHLDRLPTQEVDLSLDLDEIRGGVAEATLAVGGLTPPSAPPPAEEESTIPVLAVAQEEQAEDEAAEEEEEQKEEEDSAVGDTARACLARGIAIAKEGDLEQAVPLLDQAVMLAPRWATAYWNRAVMSSRLGDRAAAASDFAKTLALEPDHAKANWMRRYIEDNES